MARRILPTLNSRDFVAYRKLVQKDPCSYCGGRGGTKDHIVPRGAGGHNEWWNLTGACLPCNEAKGMLSLLGYLGSLH